MYILSRNYRVVLATLNAACWLVCAISVSHADDGFVKDVSSACGVFKPNLRSGEVVVWKGPCANGNAEGKGIARWGASDGTTVIFEGKFSQGKLEGIGTMFASGGDRYEGSYKDGKRDGRGVYVSANGDRFEGEYKENQRHGQGGYCVAVASNVPCPAGGTVRWTDTILAGQSMTLQFAALVNTTNAPPNGTVIRSTATAQGSASGASAAVDVAIGP